MTATQSPEYRKLALDSSNDLIESDAARGLGRYTEAALFARQAGAARVKMGRIAYDEGRFVQAASDWLSAAGCFYAGTYLSALQLSLVNVLAIDQAGHIPPERRDIRAAITKRQQQLRILSDKLVKFDRDVTQLAISKSGDKAPEVMEFMLAHLRELAGSSTLHISIALQAAYIGQQRLAEEHLSWAEKLDPDDPRLAFIRGTLLIAGGDTEGAIRLWRDVLSQSPNLPYLRLKLAEAVANRPHRGVATVEEAATILRPLLDNESVEPGIRLFATSFAATLQHGLGRDAEYRRLLEEFNRLAETTQAPLSQRLVAGLRTNMPHLFPDPRKPGGGSQNGSQSGPQSADIGAFLQNSQSISTWNLAGSVA